jgi:hypothetical protein
MFHKAATQNIHHSGIVMNPTLEWILMCFMSCESRVMAIYNSARMGNIVRYALLI